MKHNTIERLAYQGLKLPLATVSHFRDRGAYPKDADPKHLRVSTDSNLRNSLINARVAQGIQLPIGRDGFKSILRIYPNGDAPETIKRQRANIVPAHKKTVSPTAATGIRKLGKALAPTIEDLEAIITRVRAVQGHIIREMTMEIDSDITRLQQRIGTCKREELDQAFQDLQAAIERQNSASDNARSVALQQVHNDKEFPQHVFIPMICG